MAGATNARDARPARVKKVPQGTSQAQIAWQQFRKHRLALVGSGILIFLFLMALFSPFIAPYSLNFYSRTDITRFQPPTPIQFRDPETGRLVRPFVYRYTEELDMRTFRSAFVPDTSTRYPIHFFVEGAPYRLFGLIPSNIHLFGVEAPARIFLMGADNLGRDLFSRIMYASVISLTIGFGATAVSFVIAMVMGGVAGYFGGWLDELVMRLIEVISAIPTLFLLLSLRALFPIDMNPVLTLYVVLIILALVGWGGLARVIRGQMLATRELDYVQAAKSLGAQTPRIIFRHMMPSIYSYLIVALSIAVPSYILAESGLSFLGLGVSEPYASWGSLLSQAQEGGFASINQRPWVLIPGFFIILTITSFQFMGDGLRDALDPKKRK
jgi:peptide/nickel transport system permease protein